MAHIGKLIKINQDQKEYRIVLRVYIISRRGVEKDYDSREGIL